jgi:hypothetical protein
VLAEQSKREEARAIEPDFTLARIDQFYLRFFPEEQQAVQVMAWARQAWSDE